ncbi:Retrovirus-related Pol polyprotein from transposon 412 [Eumeta japonica]|uniref:Retrovirus-related Pol polyprotein from transposon 412 n=1 Tax=Eumeta variegata TaxID=151549 RepID=A0A4C2ADY1_EUMVA|nr:Retrovirus-related Pol polyprotein from transposon 412 [Eumeta japonica]
MAITTPPTDVLLRYIWTWRALPTTTMGNKYILILQDDLSKFFVCVAMSDGEAETAAGTFYNEVIRKLITVNRTNLSTKLFGNVCKLLRIEKQLLTYHPPANGALGRSHRHLAEYLRSFQRRW